jgi:hypothetical protein
VKPHSSEAGGELLSPPAITPEAAPMANDPHWIEHAHRDKSALRRETHTPAGKDISAKRLHAAEQSSNAKERERARLAETLKGLKK